MPERADSIDSFDEFFGESKKDDDRKKSPIKPKEKEPTVAAIVKNQPVVKRPQTPSTPEERILSSSNSKPKVNNTKTNGYRTKSPEISDRPESIQQKDYDSDFDEDENGFDDDQTAVESVDERKKHGSLPPPKQRPSEIVRRGSDSELKKSYTVTNQIKPINRNKKRRQETLLPYIRPQQIRQTAYPIRRHKEIISSSAKNEKEQREASAKTNDLKRLESRIAELRRQLEEQRIENSTLRTIQRREEKAIRKYEEKEYDIHRIVRDYTHEIDYIKEVLTNERETKIRMEKQIEIRDEKLRDRTDCLKKYEKIVKEKHLDERYELKEKLSETDKKLQAFQEKLERQEKYIENLEKNHRYEINQELSKQRDLKRQLEGRSEKYNDLLQKFEGKTRQIDTMHIYVQRTNKHSPNSSSNLSKSHSLQSLHNTSPRLKDEKKRQSRPRQQPSSTNDSSAKKIIPKKESNDNKPSSTDHLPPKGKPPARRLSTPKSIDEEESKIDDDIFSELPPKKLTTSNTMQRSEQQISKAQIHKRSIPPISSTNESKYNTSGPSGSTVTSSSIFKLTEPPPLASKSKARATRDLDGKWSDMFGTNTQEDSAKEDLLAKLVADEQQERRLAAAAQPTPTQRPPMNMFESSTTKPTTTTTIRPSVDPFESLFSNDSNKPIPSRAKDVDDIFSTKPLNQSTAQNKIDPFESLFGSSSTANNSRQIGPQNDRLQRPKVVQNPTRSIPNRTIVDEVEEFVL